MQYNAQQLNELISNLELEIERTTESERKLKSFFKLKNSSSDYYIEHIDVLNSLLDCCVESTKQGLKATKNSDKVYELLRNDVYKYKSKEIKKKNIKFDQVDQLEFFNFLSKLYNDPDFIERNSQKNNELLIQVKEIRKKLDFILRHQIENYFKNTDHKKKKLKEFNFKSKQELYDEAYNRSMQLDSSSCLKNIYYKDAIFTIKDDVKLLYHFTHTKFAQEQSSIFKKYLKKYLKLDIDPKKDKELLWTLGAIFAASSVASIYSSSVFDATSASEFFAAIGKSCASIFVSSSAVSIFPIAAHRRFIDKKQEQDALNEQDVIRQKYEQLEDEAFFKATLMIRYNNEAFEELKKLKEFLAENAEVDINEFNEKLKASAYIQTAFDKLERKLTQIQNQKISEMQTNEQLTTSYVLSQELKQIYGEFKQHFKSFSQEDLNKLLRLVATSPEKVDQIKEFIKTSLLFNKDLSTIQTFDELMQRLRENSKISQNKIQEYLQKVLIDAEKKISSQIQSVHQIIKIA